LSTGQAEQDGAFHEALKVPAAQAEQNEVLPTEKEPEPHEEHAVSPAYENIPAGQTGHVVVLMVMLRTLMPPRHEGQATLVTL
jgi:hypothetical protein